MVEKSPLQNAAAVLADKAKAMAEAIEGNVSPESILLTALKDVVLAKIDASHAEPRRMRYAKRICVEAKRDPDMLVTDYVPGGVEVMGKAYRAGPFGHLPQWRPLWSKVYELLPSLGGIEHEIELHELPPWSCRCTACGATQEEIADGLVDKFICPGPCTEVGIYGKNQYYELWRRPDGQRYCRPIYGRVTEEDEAAFQAWKASP